MPRPSPDPAVTAPPRPVGDGPTTTTSAAPGRHAAGPPSAGTRTAGPPAAGSRGADPGTAGPRTAGSRTADPRTVVPHSFPGPRSSRDGGRTAWVDAAKGICIVLVVLHHTVMFLAPHGLVPGPLLTLNTALASLRMPLFFLVSGLFLEPVMRRSWRSLLHRRVALFAWLYLLWTAVQFALFSSLPAGTVPPLATQDLDGLLRSPLLPAPSMWFLYALAVFPVAARLLRRVPATPLLIVTGALSALVGAGMLEIGPFGWEYMARYVFFFVLGWHGRALVERVAAATSPPRVVLAALLAGVLAAGSVLLGLHDVFGVAFALNLAAVTVGVLAAAQLAGRRVGRLAVALGRRTLPIYLVNSLVIGLAMLLVGGLQVPVALQLVLVAVVAVGAVTVPLGLHRLLLDAGARPLYDLPGRWAVRPATG